MPKKSSGNISFPNEFTIVCLIVYVLSLFLNAYVVNDYDGPKETSGFAALFIGCFVFLGGGFLEWLIWLANPLFFLSILFTIKGKNGAAIISWLACFIALSFLFWKKILASESGRLADIQNVGSGYIFWVMSLIIWAIGITYNSYEVLSNAKKSSVIKPNSKKTIE